MTTLCEWTDRGGYTENQDASLVLRLPGAIVYAVFDGHGRAHGQLASVTAARSVGDSLRAAASNGELRTRPAEALAAAFRGAHAQFLSAMHAAEPSCVMAGEVLLRPADPEDIAEGSPPWEALDGGTTATVCVLLLDRHELLVASVGDSSAMLVANAPGAAGAPSFQLAIADHTPVNATERARIAGELQ
ncbi:phosphatase 2C-like domain-containing protein, partial [Pavlovales sp. CCMP2436]